MKLAIIGTGYVGLTTGVCLAEVGHSVQCVDIDEQKLEQLRQGHSPIYEPGLDELIKKNAAAGRLTFSSDVAASTKTAEVVFICVNTPPKADGSADLKYVETVARTIAEVLDGDYKVIVDKSTVPVHTAEKVKETLLRWCPSTLQADVVSNPEFLREGSAVHDTLKPDRIVIGSDSPRATEMMLQVYQPIIEREHPPVKVVSVRSAELIKHGANSFLATKISFANLIARACEAAGADALEVLDAIGLDERIGPRFLQPGIGFGGSCFPKDLAAFKKTLALFNIDPSLLAAVEQINDDAQTSFVKKIERELWVIDGKQIAVLGLAFKPNTDDIRNSPALAIVEALARDGARLTVYDPQAMEKTRHRFPDLTFAPDPYAAAVGAEALIVCTDWDEFKHLDFSRIKAAMRGTVVFDGRNCLDRDAVKAASLQYVGVGR